MLNLRKLVTISNLGIKVHQNFKILNEADQILITQKDGPINFINRYQINNTKLEIKSNSPVILTISQNQQMFNVELMSEEQEMTNADKFFMWSSVPVGLLTGLVFFK